MQSVRTMIQKYQELSTFVNYYRTRSKQLLQKTSKSTIENPNIEQTFEMETRKNKNRNLRVLLLARHAVDKYSSTVQFLVQLHRQSCCFC